MLLLTYQKLPVNDAWRVTRTTSGLTDWVATVDTEEIADRLIATLTQDLPRVLVVVAGGNVQATLADGPVQLMIKDFDNLEAGEMFDPEAFDLLAISPADEFAAAVRADVRETSYAG